MSETTATEDQVFEMPAETAVDYDIDLTGERGYVEVSVDEAETTADVLVEDADQSITLRLSADEIRALIGSLETALKTVEANS